LRNVNLPGGIADGTSNTILLGERTGFQARPGYATPWGPVGSVLDGTSNTIIFPERGSTAFCLGNAGFEQPDISEVIDGTTNTIVVGENSRLDFCFASARVGTVADGTSNTILFGESRSDVCLQDFHPATGLFAVPEPPGAAILASALLALAIGCFAKANGDGHRPPPHRFQSPPASAAANVSQAFRLPLCKPVLNQWTRWAELPWVNASGTTTPRAWRCRRSSPTALAAFKPSSISPLSRIWRILSARLAHTPAKQSA
jgi:hypothetical protein